MTVTVRALTEDIRFRLQLTLVAGEAGLDRPIENPRVQKPGLALAGFTQSLREHRVQVFGRTEAQYLSSLAPTNRQRALRGVFAADVACVVLTANQNADRVMFDLGSELGMPVLETPLASSHFITRVQDLLDHHLSPETTLHGVLVDVFGVGALLTGPSGIGKSECALDLILRGHRLITDDTVIIKRVHDRLIGSGTDMTRNHMEVRGLGVINVLELFGSAAVRDHKLIELYVELDEWAPKVPYDRTGIEDDRKVILEVPLPRARIPIRPGRNLASIVEVAARNHLLRLQGIHSGRAFEERVERILSANALSETE